MSDGQIFREIEVELVQSFELDQRFLHSCDINKESGLEKKKCFVKARLHMRFLMRFLAQFRVQNAPYPTLHECFFREASRGLERKLSCQLPQWNDDDDDDDDDNNNNGGGSGSRGNSS